MTNKTKGYSDADLEEFRVLIEKKLGRAREQLELLQSQIYEVAENGDSDYGQDLMDDSNTNSDMEMLNNLAIHQQKYIRELENALNRIRNKSYGICEVTGTLIDKNRLRAVPTTTKSLAAKLGVVQKPQEPGGEEEDPEEQSPGSKPVQKTIISKIIRKYPERNLPQNTPNPEDDEEVFFEEDWEEEEEEKEIPYQDMDSFSSEEEAF